MCNNPEKAGSDKIVTNYFAHMHWVNTSCFLGAVLLSLCEIMPTDFLNQISQKCLLANQAHTKKLKSPTSAYQE